MPTIRLALILLLFAAGWRLWAVVAGTTIASFLVSAFLAMRARDDFRTRDPVPPSSWINALRVVRYSSVLALAVLATTLTGSMDMLFLGRFATAQDLGQYSLVKMLLVLMGVFGVAFSQGLGSLVAERHARGDRAGMVGVMSLSARLVTLVTLPIFAIFLFWGAQITPLFGPSFATSQAVVSLLAISQYILIVFGPSGWALSMTGKHLLELKILLVGLAVAVLVCWIAIPMYGQLGAATAICASVVAANLIRVLFIRHSIGAFPFGIDILAITATGLGLAWVGSAAIAQFSFPPVWNTLAGIGCFMLAYGVVGWTHLLSESEKTGIRAAVKSTTQELFASGH